MAERVLMKGNEAIAEAAIRAGCRHYFGYPITPQTEIAAYMAKKALMRSADERHPEPFWADLEIEMLEKVNQLGIGPQGFGGKTTCLAVNIEYFPTHIAGMPCAVNIGCHVTRHKSVKI